MGSQNSKDIVFRDNSLLTFEEEYLLDYNGLNTSEQSYEEDISEDSEIKSYNFMEKQKNLLDSNNSTESTKIPISFEWDLGGNSVYLTGNFCNWNQYFLMRKNSNGKHTLLLNLNKGFIQYKFKVDNEWKYNEKYPIIVDNGNKNNYIDTTNWEIIGEKSEETTNSNTESSLLPIENNIEFQNSQNNYSNYIPKRNEMNEHRQKVPEEYKDKKNIDNKIRKGKFANNNYFFSKEDDILGGNYAYKKIKKVPSEQINHMNYKINNNTKSKENNPIISSIICRHRLKFTTFVYYKNQ